jgi:hypothetical protein
MATQFFEKFASVVGGAKDDAEPAASRATAKKAPKKKR